MSTMIAGILASLVATYQKPESSTDRPVIVAPKAPKVKAPKKRLKAESDPKAPQPPIVLPSNLPPIGTYNGRTFLLALRDCGMRSREEIVEGTGEVIQQPYHDPRLVREDTIRAIAGYVGYDPLGDFGAQDLSARTMAQGEIRPVTPAEYKRVLVAATVGGYAAGMPDESFKRGRDLAARLRLASEARIAYETIKDHDGLVKALREHFTGDEVPAVLNAPCDALVAQAMARELADLETAREIQIRKDLRELGYL